MILMVSDGELTRARSACLVSCGVAANVKGHNIDAWFQSGLCAAQWTYAAAIAPEKYGWLVNQDDSAPSSGKPIVVWLLPEDTDKSREEVLDIWRSHEKHFVGPLDAFQGAMMKMYLALGEAIFDAIVSLRGVNDRILLASSDRGNNPPAPSITWHETGLRHAVEILRYGSIDVDIRLDFPRYELIRAIEAHWNQSCGDNLNRFLSYQRRMLDRDNLPDIDLELLNRQIRFEWAAVMAKLGQSGAARADIIEDGTNKNGWQFPSGKVVYNGISFNLPGIRWKLLKALVEADKPLTVDNLIAAGWEHDSVVEQNTVKNHVSNIRTELRRKLNLPSNSDPIPCCDRGGLLAWQLVLPSGQ